MSHVPNRFTHRLAHRFAIILLVFVVSDPRSARAQDSAAQESTIGLHRIADPFFAMGVGVGVSVTDRGRDSDLLTTHFNYVTPENCMKVQAIQPVEGEFDFGQADRFVAYAHQHDLNIVGHCLMWARDERTPAWFFQDGDVDCSPDRLMSRLEHHIDTVVKRYKGRIGSWDVVNEALTDGSDGFLRDSGWSRIAGDAFIVKAFEFAHAADPDAFLIYNDYRCDTDAKRDKLIRLVEMLKSHNAPVHGIGLQGHYELDAVPYDGLEAVLAAMREIGLKVVISELDIDVVKRGRWWADGGKHREELASFDPYKDGCPTDVLERQAEQYARLFELFIKYDDVVQRVSFWNLHDGQSWLNYFPWRRVNHPLLFDRQRQPKPSFDAVVAVMRKLADEDRKSD